MGLKIKDMGVYIPHGITSNQWLEERINQSGIPIPFGTFQRVFGIETRSYAAKDEQVSDMAVKAAESLWDRHDKQSIDLMLFGSASGDMIEPSTSSIVNHKIGLNCPSMDIKNACNSFVSALHVANAFLTTGFYKKILLLTAEKVSDSIRMDPQNLESFKSNIAAFSFGDAASAIILENGMEHDGIIQERLYTNGEYWDLCCIPGGGSVHPHDGDKTYFTGKTHLLKDVFLKHGIQLVHETLEKCGWKMEEIDHLITHQVSVESLKEIVNNLGIPGEKCVNVFHKYGNTAAASIPLAMSELINTNRIQPGDKVLILGLAAGINISIHCMVW